MKSATEPDNMKHAAGPGNIFLSKYWIDTWLEVLSSTHPRTRDKTIQTGQGYLVPKTDMHLRVFSRKALYLNEYPDGPVDFTMEYNGLIPGKSGRWEDVLCDLLAKKNSWDVLKFRRLNSANTDSLQSACRTLGIPFETVERIDAPWVYLDSSTSFSEIERQCLTANKRRQIKRAKRYYEEKYGPITVTTSNPQTDQPSWQELSELHTIYWKARNQPGAFNPAWKDFHTRMWQRENDLFQPSLVKVQAGSHLVGIIYSLVLDGVVNQIQSGFNYAGEANIAKPGYLCHWLTTEQYFNKGCTAYGLLGSKDAFKASIANKTDHLTSIAIWNPANTYRLERLIRKLKDHFRTPADGDLSASD